MEPTEEEPKQLNGKRTIRVDFAGVHAPYTIEYFKRMGFYKEKPSNGNGHGVIEDGDVITDLPSDLQRRLRTVSDKAKEDPSVVDFGVICTLLEQGLSPQDTRATFANSPRGRDAAERHPKFDDWIQRTVVNAVAEVGRKSAVTESAAGSDWRKEFKSKNQLCRAAPRCVIQRLVPEKSLTMITAPSFHGKSWIALHPGKAISVGKGLWGFDGPERPVPFRYHVPEMDESMVRQRMEMLHISDSDMFLVRAMESGVVWPLGRL